jgi:hypothetical protein
VLTRYFIFISFKGTSYHGWQVQPKAVTIQKILDEAISVIQPQVRAGPMPGFMPGFFVLTLTASSLTLLKRRISFSGSTGSFLMIYQLRKLKKFCQMQMQDSALFPEPTNIMFHA